MSCVAWVTEELLKDSLKEFEENYEGLFPPIPSKTDEDTFENSEKNNIGCFLEELLDKNS